MIIPIFTIYDSKAQYFGPPWIHQNTEMGLRAFSDIANEPGNPVYQHPSDFSLVEIATYNDETGVIAAIDHINYGVATSFKKGDQS